ncbi:MAG: phage tail protein [Rhodocyclaceae bacterium]|nr:phage tail protein [Rhodocyclaceae bacterium]
MASLAISAAGAAVGFMMGGPMGAEVGWMAGSMLGNVLFPQKVQGPRLADKEVHLTSYGNAIALTYGTTREPGSYLWCSSLIEHSTTQSAKGGPSTTTYSYSVNMAVALCLGVKAGVVRVWANKRLIYDASAANGSVTIDPCIGAMRFYPGSETQTVDPLLVAATGGVHPAYRGVAYLVFENLDCSTNFGNRPPMIEAEVASVGTPTLPPPKLLLDVTTAYGGAFMTAPQRDPATGYAWTVAREGSGPYTYYAYAYNEVTDTLVRIPFPAGAVPGGTMSLCVVTSTRECWVAWETYPYGSIPFIAIFSADGLAGVTTILRPSSVSGWTGIIGYDSAADKVVVATSNIGGVLYSFQPETRQYLGAVNFGAATGALIPLPGADLVAKWWSSLTTIDFARYTGVGAGGYSVAGSATVAHYLGGFAYDSSRNRLAYFPNPAWNSDPIQVIDLVTFSVTNYPNTANVGAFQGGVIYHVQNDCFYTIADPVNNTLYKIDAASFATSVVTSYGSASGLAGYLLEVPGVRDYLLDQGGYFRSQYWRVFLDPVLDGNAVALSTIVSDLCVRAGYGTGDVNVSQLGDLVDGYSVRQVMPARAAIEPLMQAYFFDAVESDAVLKFVKRGGAIAVTIPEDDLAAHDHSAGNVPDQLALTRGQELELPREVVVQYVDAAFDFQTNAQYSRRLTTPAKGKVNVALAISLSATAARRIADVLLYEAWMARTAGDFILSRKYAYLEPTDVVQVVKAGHTYTLRLTDKSEAAPGLYTLKAALDDPGLYMLDASGLSVPGGAATPPGATVATSSPTALRLLDIPLLRDQDDGIGFYAAAAGYFAGWTGAQLYKSTDNGYSWLAVDTPFVTASVIGTTANALGNFQSGTIFDELNTLTVNLLDTAAVLTPTTALNVLNGQNGALVGDEIIQFKNATLTAPGVYVLSGLLRGRRGTERAMASHVIGERFVFLDAGALHLETASSSEWNVSRLYKAVTFGALISAAGSIPFTDTAVAQKCYAPVLLGGGRDAGGNLTLTWTRRTRVYGAWNDLADVPLGEASESYVITIYSDATYTTVKRTLTATSPTVAYSAANQTADFGSVPAKVYWSVAQVSATTGNGYSAQGAI